MKCKSAFLFLVLFKATFTLLRGRFFPLLMTKHAARSLCFVFKTLWLSHCSNEGAISSLIIKQRLEWQCPLVSIKLVLKIHSCHRELVNIHSAVSILIYLNFWLSERPNVIAVISVFKCLHFWFSTYKMERIQYAPYSKVSVLICVFKKLHFYSGLFWTLKPGFHITVREPATACDRSPAPSNCIWKH